MNFGFVWIVYCCQKNIDGLTVALSRRNAYSEAYMSRLASVKCPICVPGLHALKPLAACKAGALSEMCNQIAK